ncbi:dTDP-glucose 4,6-dehydratase [Haloferula chungangensis]|uniref:dTDP-glucose 4,6-dehydratase n=1 Tax=Haloferula chungangensis TaxID=1048331 RepID=A0ABW2LCX4_9BACT
MNVLVSGGAGFIGSNLVWQLLNSAEVEVGKVVTLDKLTYAGSLLNLDRVAGDPRHGFVEGDVGDEQLVTKLLMEHDIDAVMHLAAETHVDRSIDGPDEFVETNVVGTFRMLEAFRSHLASRSRKDAMFLHVSTDEVFGSLGADDPPFHEGSAYAPNSPYSASKAGADHLVRSYHQTYGMPTVTTYCPNNFGPYQFPEKLVPLMIRKMLKGEPLPVYGDGKNVRDWIFVEDHCRALVAVLKDGVAGKSYCIGGRCPLTNLEVLGAIREVLMELETTQDFPALDEMIEKVADRPGHDRRYELDPSRIEKELGWSASLDFMEGMRRTVRWYLESEAWVRAVEEGGYQGERLGVDL